MSITDADVAKVVEMYFDRAEDGNPIGYMSASWLKDVIDCIEVLNATGNDPLFFEDGNVILALVKWKRGEDA